MATDFLIQRHREFFAETAGESTVEYHRYTPVAGDSLTREVDRGQSFSQLPVAMAGLVDFAPSRAMREKVGMEINFDATVRLCRAICNDGDVRPRVGDEIVLPDESARYTVVQVIKEKQSKAGFLEYILAVARKVGRGGQ